MIEIKNISKKYKKDKKVIDVYERSISAGTNREPKADATNAKTNCDSKIFGSVGYCF